MGPDYPISDSMQPAGAVSSGPACTCTSCTGRYKFKSSFFFFFGERFAAPANKLSPSLSLRTASRPTGRLRTPFRGLGGLKQA